MTIVFNVFGFAFTSMIPVIGARQLALDAFWVGVLSSLEGLGAFLGAILVAVIARPENHFHIYFRGVAVYLTLVGALALAAFNVAALPAPFRHRRRDPARHRHRRRMLLGDAEHTHLPGRRRRDIEAACSAS